MKKSLFLFVCLMLGLAIEVSAAHRSGNRPQWVSKGEQSLNDKRSNDSYYFKVIRISGRELQQLRRESVNTLADYIGKENKITGMSVTEAENINIGNDISSSETFRMTFKNEFSTDEFQAALVDDYWEQPDKFGEYMYYALYAVSERPLSAGAARFDHFEVSRSYGAAPALMSIIPGVGQLYKGQKVKGFLMLGGAVLCAGAIVLCENQRAYNHNRIIEQPKFAKTYSSRSNSWATGRNVAIGATGALMVWSIIDAAVVPGATRIKVSPNTTATVRPTALATPDAVGLGATLAISF